MSLQAVQALASSAGVSAGASLRALKILKQFNCGSLSEVTEVVTMQTRAVSHFFSSSKARFGVSRLTESF